MIRSCLCFASLVTVALAGQAAEQPTPAAMQDPAPAQRAAQPPAPPIEKPSDAGWSYDPEGRRDPFLSLLGRGNDPRVGASRPAGVAGLLIADVTVKGILRDKSGFVAMIQSPDSKTFIVRPGDRLFDGSVKSILSDKVIFSQDVNDPLSLVKQREIPKAVRASEGRGASPGL
jgi:type IV pilus assembly protein PilP